MATPPSKVDTAHHDCEKSPGRGVGRRHDEPPCRVSGYPGPADGYNGFFFGNYTNANSDVGGKPAAGGNITLQNMGVAVQHGADFYDGQYALLAVRNLTATNGEL